MNSYAEYDARIGSIKWKEISMWKENRSVLLQLKNNDRNLTRLKVGGDCHWESDYVFYNKNEDLGWLGYYMRKNSRLKELTFLRERVPNAQFSLFFQGLAANTSLESIHFRNHCDCGVIPREVHPRMSQFFASRRNLLHVAFVCGCVADEELEALAPSLENMSQLKSLCLLRNPLITARGYQVLLTLLRSPASSLENLDISDNNAGDAVAIMFANALASNCKLQTLKLDRNNLTTRGLTPFSQLLCDTTSIEATFLSNHTLTSLGFLGAQRTLPDQESRLALLHLNRYADKKEIARIKILRHHPVLDLPPALEWGFKVLPLAVDWLERGPVLLEFADDVDRRKLRTIHHFVRKFPEEYFEACRLPVSRKRSNPTFPREQQGHAAEGRKRAYRALVPARNTAT